MIPATHNITVRRGDTFSMFCRARDKVWDPVNSVYVPGDYKDLTGWTGSCQLRATEDSAEVVVTATVVLGNQTTTPGSFFVNMADDVTATIAVNNGVYDVQFVTPAGETYTFLGGTWTLSKDVTR